MGTSYFITCAVLAGILLMASVFTMCGWLFVVSLFTLILSIACALVVSSAMKAIEKITEKLI